MNEKEKWESRYDSGDYIHGARPSDFLCSNSEYLPKSGTALDLASGEGRNAVYLAEAGLEVFALDFSVLALRKCLRLASERGCVVHVAAVDLSNYSIPACRFEVITNFNFLLRPLSGSIARGLMPGGYLFFETLTVDHLRWNPEINPDYLLGRGELIEMFGELQMIKYRETTIRSGAKPRSVASLIARKV